MIIHYDYDYYDDEHDDYRHHHLLIISKKNIDQIRFNIRLLLSLSFFLAHGVFFCLDTRYLIHGRIHDGNNNNNNDNNEGEK